MMLLTNLWQTPPFVARELTPAGLRSSPNTDLAAGLHSRLRDALPSLSMTIWLFSQTYSWMA
jgi:hypothetical protein